MNKHTRRRFLLSGLSAGAGLSALGGLSPIIRLARASEGSAAVGEKHRYYIFCYFGGGWDVLVTLDPRDPAVFTKSAIPDTKTAAPGHGLAGRNGFERTGVPAGGRAAGAAGLDFACMRIGMMSQGVCWVAWASAGWGQIRGYGVCGN